MMIYTSVRFKPKKKRKPKGEIAKRLRMSSLPSGVHSMPSLSYGPRAGADVAKNIGSLNSDAFSVSRKESIKYTGTLVKGIATMHKSNAVPVIDEEQMKDISRMRRG